MKKKKKFLSNGLNQYNMLYLLIYGIILDISWYILDCCIWNNQFYKCNESLFNQYDSQYNQLNIYNNHKSLFYIDQNILDLLNYI